MQHLTEKEIREKFDIWYKSQKEMNPYIMRDYWLSFRSQELQGLKEEIGSLKTHDIRIGHADPVILAMIPKHTILALLENRLKKIE